MSARAPWFFLASAIALTGGCGPGPGAVKIAITYAGPRDICLIVRVSPTANPSKVEERTLTKLPRLATRSIGVIPAAGEGDALTVVIEAHERGCSGPRVWKQEQSAVAARPTGVIEAGILIRDADDDTFADATGSFAGGQAPGTDCDDSLAASHPGAEELCNGLDDDCNGVIDDGLTQRFFFLDQDRDGFGNEQSDAGQSACLQPLGYAADAGDCDDFREAIHPGAVESCNGFDDNCDALQDEGFAVGEGCDAGCGGTMQCTDAGSVACFSPSQPLNWYLDGDGDGHGMNDGGAILACVQPEPGRTPSSDDCDDGNRFIHVGAREVCDGLDDDCDPTTLESCADAGFRKFPLPTGNAQWRAVAPFGRGFTWVVGLGNQIVLRYFEPSSGSPPVDAGPFDAGADGGSDGGMDAGEPEPFDASGPWDAGVGDGGFFNYALKCIGEFKAAWAAPSGRLYLGEINHIDRLELDGGCVESWFSVLPYGEVQGISGVVSADGGITLFVAVNNGRVLRIADLGDAGASNDRTWTTDAGSLLYTVAPFNRDEGLVAGHWPTQAFYFARLESDGGVSPKFLPNAGVQYPYVLASGYLSPSLTYLAGFNNTMFRYDGQNFSPISGPGPATSHFVGLQAFGNNHALATDTLSRVYRFHGTLLPDAGTTADLWLDLSPQTGGSPMRALKGTAPDDVWVVGDNNNVLHFGD